MFCDVQGLMFLLLFDFDCEVLMVWGVYGEKQMYGKMVQGVIWFIFVVDEDGKIVVVQYNVKVIGYVVKFWCDLLVQL